VEYARDRLPHERAPPALLIQARTEDVDSIETTSAMPTITSRGRITIPSRIRTALRLRAGDRVEFVEMEKGQFVMIAANRSVRELNGLFYDKRRKPVQSRR
jgi:AbrB family looped-hinge helix DNA binding protein